MKAIRNLSLSLVVPLMVLLATNPAFAAVDPAVSTAIATAQTDALTVAGVLTAMVAVIWGALFIKRKFFG